jgi:hypothetical protein
MLKRAHMRNVDATGILAVPHVEDRYWKVGKQALSD